MIYCHNCKELFENEDAKRTPNYVPYGMTEITESTSVECPHCNSNDLEFDVVMVTCEKCKREVPDTHAYRACDGTFICCECADKEEIE